MLYDILKESPLIECDKEGFSMTTRKLLTLREASDRTGHRESTYRSWVLQRRIPYFKVGRSVRIAESDLDQIIERARIPAREEHHGS